MLSLFMCEPIANKSSGCKNAVWLVQMRYRSEVMMEREWLLTKPILIALVSFLKK